MSAYEMNRLMYDLREPESRSALLRFSRWTFFLAASVPPSPISVALFL